MEYSRFEKNLDWNAQLSSDRNSQVWIHLWTKWCYELGWRRGWDFTFCVFSPGLIKKFVVLSLLLGWWLYFGLYWKWFLTWTSIQSPPHF